MYRLNEYYPIRVPTQRGLLEMDAIRPGDEVFEFRTSKRIEVIGTSTCNPQDMYKITYSDGRSQVVCDEDRIWDGNKVWTPLELQVAIKHSHHDVISARIKLEPIDYLQGKIVNPVFPDPMIAGALIIYGDYDDPYINLPLDREGIDDHFSHRYNLNFGSVIGNNKVYYKFDGAPPDSLITWKEFFPKYDFYATSKCFEDPIIPDEYYRASIKDRWHFVQGAFSIGYSKDTFPKSVSVAHINEHRLEELQKMLWSLGIMSKITYDPNMISAHGRQYRLDVAGIYTDYPGFFYDAWMIQNVINANIRRNSVLTEPYSFHIKSIEKLGRGWCSNIILKTSGIYYTENFTPRISL